MSPNTVISSRTLSIGLAPETLGAVVRCQGRIVAHSDIRIAADADGGYDGALDCLRYYLSRAGSALDGVPVSVAVSVRWCQLKMLPWSDALLYADGARRHCEAHFSAIYGELARTWDFVCDDAPYGQARLACAFDAGLVAGLRAIAQQNGHTLAGVASALNVAARSLASTHDQAIAVIEPQRIVLATMANGRVDAVQAHACIGAWHSYLPDAWQSWTLREPQAGEIAKLALVSIDEGGPFTPLPSPRTVLNAGRASDRAFPHTGRAWSRGDGHS